jgi:hypothetical protein
MPTRLIREGILDSDAVNSLSWPAEVFYRRLMSVVDDFGRFDGRIPVLKSRLYPLQLERVRDADIPRWIAECEKAGLIRVYTNAGKPYILFNKLGEPRAKESKYPAPPADANGETGNEDGREHLKTSARICKQTPADVPYSYSDTNSYSDSGSDKDSSEPGDARPEPKPDDPIVVTFPVVGGKSHEWHFTQSHADELAAAFPGVGIIPEARKALAWCNANKTRRKTAKGMPNFLLGWMGRAQNRSAGTATHPPPMSFKTAEAVAVQDSLAREIQEAKEREAQEAAALTAKSHRMALGGAIYA